MTPEQFAILNEPAAQNRMTPDLLMNKHPRTLIYGYQFDRSTFHCYLSKDQEIVVAQYDSQNLLISVRRDEDALTFAECIPQKRAYPETCDFEFCRILKQAGEHVPFTNWGDRESAQFYGKVLDQLYVGVTVDQLAQPLNLVHTNLTGPELFPGELDWVARISRDIDGYLRDKLFRNGILSGMWLNGLKLQYLEKWDQITEGGPLSDYAKERIETVVNEIRVQADWRVEALSRRLQKPLKE